MDHGNGLNRVVKLRSEAFERAALCSMSGFGDKMSVKDLTICKWMTTISPVKKFITPVRTPEISGSAGMQCASVATPVPEDLKKELISSDGHDPSCELMVWP